MMRERRIGKGVARRTAFIGPARRPCRRNAREFQRHFAGSLPCSSPPCADLPAASRGLHPGRSPLWHSAPWLTMTGLVSSERTSCLPELIAPVRRGGLPLNEHRSGDQQHKKDRQQYRGHEPLANTEFDDIGHIGRLLVAAGAQCSQSPITAGEARGDMEDMVTLRRITRLGATYLSVGQGCNPIPE